MHALNGQLMQLNYELWWTELLRTTAANDIVLVMDHVQDMEGFDAVDAFRSHALDIITGRYPDVIEPWWRGQVGWVTED